MTTFQPFINHDFPDFYLTFSPIVTANWEASNGQHWLVALGLGAGKLLRVRGKGPPTNVNVSYNNVAKPDNAATWTLLTRTLLIPR